jgi:hypothetical protein
LHAEETVSAGGARTITTLVAIAAMPPVLAACGDDASQPNRPQSARVSTERAGERRGAATPAPAPRPFVVPCSRRVSGGLPDDYLRDSLRAGPLALYGAASNLPYMDPLDQVDTRTRLRRSLDDRITARERRRLKRALRRTPPGGFGATDLDVTVGRGRRATVVGAPSDRSHLALLFDSRAWNRAGTGFRIADGDAAVTFRGCGPRRFTQFHGGLAVDRPGCFGLDVRVDRERRTRRIVLSVARGDCGALAPGDPDDPALPLAPPRETVREACRRVAIACPTLLPVSSEDGPTARDFSGRSAVKLLDVEDSAAVEAGDGTRWGAAHLLVGATPRELPVFGARGRRWPPPWLLVKPPAALAVPLRDERVRSREGRRIVIAQRPTILGPALVGDRPAVLLRSAPYPRGGLHGGHVLAVWNDRRRRGHLVSLHYGGAPLRTRLRAALAVAASIPGAG